LCDGNNSTPDLRNRFVVGAGTGGNYSPGDTGGANSVTLTVDQIPPHSHIYQNQVAITNASERPWPASNNDCRLDDANTSSTGGGQSHENRPPYYALCYIMKT
jgi:microcystin-dependent protein